MKIGQVETVQVVGEVSNRLLKSASMVGIWGDREGMITTIWDNYKKKDLEKVLNDNRKTEQDAIKVRACILLFASVCDIPVFKQIKSKYHW